MNKHGKEMRQREVRPPCGPGCKFKCRSNFNSNERKEIFHKYYRMTLSSKRNFLVKYSTKKTKSRNKHKYKRMKSYRYFLPTESQGERRVCKDFFLGTFDISQTSVYTAHKKHENDSITEEQRGKSTGSRWNKKTKEDLQSVRKHIMSFPTIEAHYCRKDTKRQYLEPGLSVTRMYELYYNDCKTKNETPVSIQVYRRLFNTEFNLGFHQPRKDQCDFCNSYKNASTKEKSQLSEKYETHIRNKNLAREQKEADKVKAKSDPDLVVACFDLEQVLMTPKGFESALYYKRKLNTYNFTIYNLGNSEVHSYIWNETISSRGACDIASAVFSFIKEKSVTGVKKFIFYSDNCIPQNKNKFYITMLWYCLQKFDLTKIEHKYLEKGHTFNENDSAHAAIETTSRHLSVYTTSQWAAIVRSARPKRPYIVKEMSLDDFYDFKSLSMSLKNFDMDEDRNKFLISEVKALLLKSCDPNKFFFKNDHSVEQFCSVNLLLNRGLRRTSDCVNPRMIELAQLRTLPIPITLDKYNDLVALCISGVIPKPNHIFYALLQHTNE